MPASITLECPACSARFPVPHAVADDRVRCRSCRAVIIVPPIGSAVETPLDPELRVVVWRSLSLPRRFLLAAVSLAALGVLGWSAVTVYRERGRSPAPETGPVKMEDLPRLNAASFFPLGLGRRWEYSGPDGLEQVAVVAAAGGDGLAPPGFTVRRTTRAGEESDVYRLERNAVLWVRHGHVEIVPPLKLLPVPLGTDSSWAGGSARVGGEDWVVNFVAEGAETITVPAGTFPCTRVHATFSAAGRTWTRTLWLARGVGIVRREGSDLPRQELKSMSRP